MSGTAGDHDLVRVRQSAHGEHMAAIDEVRAALAREDKTKASIEAVFAKLCQLIENQFAREEEGGYLNAVVEQAPRLETRIDSLLADHQELLDQTEKLRLLIHSGVDLPSWWSCVENDFECLAAKLTEHHHAEIGVLQQAFDKDIGTGD